MGYLNEKLWDILKQKIEEDDAKLQEDVKCGNEYLAAVKKICEYGVDRAKTIRDTFPMFTLHDERHICNVIRLMEHLLGEKIEQLSRDETAMLMMSACCHDIGMSYKEEEKEEILEDLDKINQYLDKNHGEYVKAYANGTQDPVLTDEMISRYLRTIHHERAEELLYKIEWPEILCGKIDRDDLVRVCMSHGNDIGELDHMEPTAGVDLRFCSILLRLADILDFDTSRAPKTIYEYSGLEKADTPNSIKSKEEWDKHMVSHGFDFDHVIERKYPYTLEYNATCKSMQVEQTVNSYLDWVDKEFMECNRQLSRFNGKWKEFILPGKIKRTIVSEGYVSGQYRLTLDQEQVMDLLVGRDLYSDPAVFVRELIQNSIDAVRTREKLDRELPSGWKGQINIRTWRDNEGYHWFRIEDNGIGMTEDIIKNFFLKIGCSYYNSDTFQQLKLRCRADADYMPISRFGIGILSCFMGDEKTNQVEVSTKHFKELGTYHPALRLSMHGMNGYFYLANKEKQHKPGPMKGVTTKEKEPYLKQPGTVIAVRTNLYQNGKYRGFKEIIDKYVIYPEVPIHYEGEEGILDYPTEKEFMDTIRSIGEPDTSGKHRILELPMLENDLKQLYEERPELHFKETPRVILHCIPLDSYTDSPFLSGAILTAKVQAEHEPITLTIGKDKKRVEVKSRVELSSNKKRIKICFELVLSYAYKEQLDNFKEELERNIRARRTGFLLDKAGSYEAEILEAIISFEILNIEWERYVTKTYNISLEELQERVENILNELSEEMGEPKVDRDMIKKIKEYSTLTTVWKFDVCNLENYEWFNKYFYKKRLVNLGCNITSHNGILCGDAEFFYSSRYRDENIGTLLLLKDKYRPAMDVARNIIRTLTLETLCDLETIGCEIKGNNIFIDGDLMTKLGIKIYHIPAKIYMHILDTRDDFDKRIKYLTDKGFLNIDQLKSYVEKEHRVELIEFPRMGEKGWYKERPLYLSIGIALLKKYFSLSASKKNTYRTNYSIFIEKQDGELTNNLDILPVNFFMKIKDETEKLTASSAYDRYFCNEHHILSQFIIKNTDQLREYVPGILEEMQRTLAEDNKENIIKNVNYLLDCLRNFPDGLFQVPEGLVLTENDFY